jgi:polygalacturonase
MQAGRPFTFFILGCNNVVLRDIIIHDGALWTVRLSGCKNVLIHGVHIENDLKLPNNDGIDRIAAEMCVSATVILSAEMIASY